MKRSAALLMLLTAGLVFAQNPKPGLADYPITVHVAYSRSIYAATVAERPFQQVEAIINGLKVELSRGGGGVLALGDYSAKPSSKAYAPKTRLLMISIWRTIC